MNDGESSSNPGMSVGGNDGEKGGSYCTVEDDDADDEKLKHPVQVRVVS